MEKALRDRLIADVAVGAIVGERIFWVDRPQATDLPAITLQDISAGRTYTMDGASDLHGARVQFDLWGLAYRDVAPLFDAVLAAMEQELEISGVSFGMSFLDSRRAGRRENPPEDVPGIGPAYRITADFIIWWRPL